MRSYSELRRPSWSDSFDCWRFGVSGYLHQDTPHRTDAPWNAGEIQKKVSENWSLPQVIVFQWQNGDE